MTETTLCIVQTRRGLETVDIGAPLAGDMYFGVVPYYRGRFLAVFNYLTPSKSPFPVPANWTIG